MPAGPWPSRPMMDTLPHPDREEAGRGDDAMKIEVVVYGAEEGGYWAEVPAIPVCATPGDPFEELLKNLFAAIAGLPFSHH